LIVGLLAASDFDKAFRVFHTVFFPGKDNWVFDPHADEIIKAMPEEFFMNCAILIISSIVIISLLLILLGATAKRKSK
jgi:integral membrane protein (TIGR01906 family)